MIFSANTDLIISFVTTIQFYIVIRKMEEINPLNIVNKDKLPIEVEQWTIKKDRQFGQRDMQTNRQKLCNKKNNSPLILEDDIKVNTV